MGGEARYMEENLEKQAKQKKLESQMEVCQQKTGQLPARTRRDLDDHEKFEDEDGEEYILVKRFIRGTEAAWDASRGNRTRRGTTVDGEPSNCKPVTPWQQTGKPTRNNNKIVPFTPTNECTKHFVGAAFNDKKAWSLPGIGKESSFAKIKGDSADWIRLCQNSYDRAVYPYATLYDTRMKIPIYSAVNIKRKKDAPTVAALNVGAGTFRFAFGAGNYQQTEVGDFGGGGDNGAFGTGLLTDIDTAKYPKLSWLAGISVRKIDISNSLKGTKSEAAGNANRVQAGETQLRAYPWSRFSLPLCSDSIDGIYPNIPAKWKEVGDEEPDKPWDIKAYKSDLGGYFDLDNAETNQAANDAASDSVASNKRKRRDIVRLEPKRAKREDEEDDTDETDSVPDREFYCGKINQAQDADYDPNGGGNQQHYMRAPLLPRILFNQEDTTFTLTNAAPMDKPVYLGEWYQFMNFVIAMLENEEYGYNDKDVYIMAGTMGYDHDVEYIGLTRDKETVPNGKNTDGRSDWGNDGVKVPTHFWFALCMPQQSGAAKHDAWVYFTNNEASDARDGKFISVADFNRVHFTAHAHPMGETDHPAPEHGIFHGYPDCNKEAKLRVMLNRANEVITARGFPVEQYQDPKDYGKTFWNAFCTGARYPYNDEAGSAEPKESYWDVKTTSLGSWEEDTVLRAALDKDENVHDPAHKISGQATNTDCGASGVQQLCGVPVIPDRCKKAGEDIKP